MLIFVPDKAVMEKNVVRSLSRIHELGEDIHSQYFSQTLDKVTVQCHTLSAVMKS